MNFFVGGGGVLYSTLETEMSGYEAICFLVFVAHIFTEDGGMGLGRWTYKGI